MSQRTHVCVNPACGQEHFPTRKGRCPQCARYIARHGVERPQEVVNGKRLPRPRGVEPRECSRCLEMSTRIQLGRCPACYQYFKAKGEERPFARIFHVKLRQLGLRLCRTCRTALAIKAFHKGQWDCKDCQRKAMAIWKERHPESWKRNPEVHQRTVERTRARRGSTKTGPPSRYKGDEVARLAALAEGKKRCPECGEAKGPAQFSKDGRTPDGLSCYCRQCRARHKAEDYERNRELRLMQKKASAFGITVEEVRALHERQGGLCAICRRPCPTGRALAIDHCHETGEIRDLLCANCNRGIGLLQDSPEVAYAAFAYLAKWKGSNGKASTEPMQ